jgi:hypothetical protein
MEQTVSTGTGSLRSAESLNEHPRIWPRFREQVAQNPCLVSHWDKFSLIAYLRSWGNPAHSLPSGLARRHKALQEVEEHRNHFDRRFRVIAVRWGNYCIPYRRREVLDHRERVLDRMLRSCCCFRPCHDQRCPCHDHPCREGTDENGLGRAHRVNHLFDLDYFRSLHRCRRDGVDS